MNEARQADELGRLTRTADERVPGYLLMGRGPVNVTLSTNSRGIECHHE